VTVVIEGAFVFGVIPVVVEVVAMVVCLTILIDLSMRHVWPSLTTSARPNARPLQPSFEPVPQRITRE
jgi:hypothetical protein